MQRSLVLLSLSGTNDEQDENEYEDCQKAKEERDTDDERSEDDDREPSEIQKDYLGVVDNAHYLTCFGNAWCTIDELSLHGPVSDILVPPPKPIG